MRLTSLCCSEFADLLNETEKAVICLLDYVYEGLADSQDTVIIRK